MELTGTTIHSGSAPGRRAVERHPLAEGRLLVLEKPISFWGGVDPLTGAIMDPRHPRHGMRLGGHILVMERTIGSSSSSAVMLELLRNRVAPAAIVVGRTDAILVLGLLVAEELGYDTIPVVRMDERSIARLAEVDGTRATIKDGTLRIRAANSAPASATRNRPCGPRTTRRRRS